MNSIVQSARPACGLVNRGEQRSAVFATSLHAPRSLRSAAQSRTSTGFSREQIDAEVTQARHRHACCLSATRTPVVFGGAADDESITVELKVEGMMCGGCSSRIEEVIKKMDGVKSVNVSLEKKLAQIEVKAKSQIDAAQALPMLVQAVKDLGFEAEPHFA